MSRREEKKARKPKAKNAPVAKQVPRLEGDAPGGDKTPRRAFTPPSTEGLVSVSLGEVDIAGPFCISQATPEELVSILRFLHDVERMTPQAAFGGYPGKDYDIDGIPNDVAKGRLVELGYDDEDRITRFQLTGQQRLYGFRRGARFYALWWDPGHDIWPSQKKHT